MIGRRSAIGAAFGGLGAALSGTAHAGTYPSSLIRLIVPYGPGSGTDAISRAAAEAMANDLGVRMIVENRPGANGEIGSAYVARSKPDGYTLLTGTNGTMVTGPYIQPGLSFDPTKDLAPVAMLAYLPFILVVPTASPVHTVADLVALAKSKPGNVTFGSEGIGSSGHLAAALFEQAAGVSMRHIPYTGAAAVLIDLIAGRLDCFFAALPSAMGAIRSNQLRAVAMATRHRSALFPDLPTIAEAGYAGYDAGTWVAIMAPANTPGDIVAKLSDSAIKALGSGEVKVLLAKLGAEPDPMSPTVLADYLAHERQRWGTLIKAMGIGKH